jgi:hypothetical protein
MVSGCQVPDDRERHDQQHTKQEAAIHAVHWQMMFLQEARSRDELRRAGGPADAPFLRTPNNSVVVDGCVSSKGERREH